MGGSSNVQQPASGKGPSAPQQNYYAQPQQSYYQQPQQGYYGRQPQQGMQTAGGKGPQQGMGQMGGSQQGMGTPPQFLTPDGKPLSAQQVQENDQRTRQMEAQQLADFNAARTGQPGQGSQQAVSGPTGATGTSATAVPSDVMARYNQVNQAQPSPMPQQPQSQSQGQGSGQGAGSFGQVGSAGGSPGGPSSMPPPQAQAMQKAMEAQQQFLNNTPQGAVVLPGYEEIQRLSAQQRLKEQATPRPSGPPQGFPPQLYNWLQQAQGQSQSSVGGQGAYADGGEVMPGQSLLMMERK
jgi:hypothetical protein